MNRLIKIGTKHLWVVGIQVCTSEGSCPFPRGDNYEIVKIHLKIFSNDLANVNQTWHKASLVKRIHDYSK